MKRAIVSAAVAAIVLAGCSSNGSDGADAPEPSETPSSQPEATTEEPSGADDLSLVEEWQPKLLTLRDSDSGACDDAASMECGARVLAIMETALELSEAIIAEGESGYPETNAAIADVAAAGASYNEALCMGNSSAPDSCAGDVFSLKLAPQAMHNSLEMDYLNSLG